MSYDIYFVQGRELSVEDVNEILESETVEGEEHFISKALMHEVKDALLDEGLSFETFEGKEDDYLELNFETYQISMSNSEIAISLPYWDINGSDTINNEVNVVSTTLINKGFIGYDPQTEKLFDEPKGFSTDFGQVNEKVNEYFSPEPSSKKHSEGWRLIKLGLIFVGVVLLIRLIASLIGKLF